MQKSHAFNLTGAERKPLIDAIESFTQVKPVYQGAPKFGYAFFDVGVLDKEGTFHFDCDMQVIMDLVTWLEDCGFHCSADESTDIPAFESLNMTMEEELGLGRQRRDYWGEDSMQESNVPEPDIDKLIISSPLDGFTPEKLDNLFKLVNAKLSLLKTVFGAEELPIILTECSIDFPWFSGELDGDATLAYTTLIAKLCAAAKEKQRVTAKEHETDNPKYAMRCWLLSLGMIGTEYKTTRKILLKNLDGNSAFKAGKAKSAEVTVDEISE